MAAQHRAEEPHGATILFSFACICGLFLLGAALLHFGDVLFSRKSRNWMTRTYTQIGQEIYPETISFVVGASWWLLSLPSTPVLISVARMFSGWCKKAVFYYRGENVRGYVALTIDDAPGRGEPLTEQVLAVLEEFDAKCTFFVVSNYMDRHEDFLVECVQRGHELANHGGDDIPYHRYSESDFREVLLDCQQKIDNVVRAVAGRKANRVPAIKWFRPPQGKMSAAMEAVLSSFGYRIALCDCWGMDVLCGADFVQRYTLRHVRDGSIVLVHMPEEGFREWTLPAIRGILAGLKQRGIKCVSLSQLDALATSTS